MILIDENVPKSVYTELRRRGYDAKHVIFIKRGLKDKEIVDLANREKRIIVTLDEDFIRLSKFVKTKVILIRRKIERRKIESLVDILEKAFNIEGKVIIIRENYIEVL